MWALLLVAFVAAGGGDLVRDFGSRGRRLTSSTLDGAVVRETPAALAAAAAALLGRPVDVDAYALARMIRSEHGTGPDVEKVAMAHVALNDAADLGWPLVRALCFDRADRAGERFGTQQGGRYSTARDPYEVDLRIAEAVLSGAVSDPTGGAVKFVHAGAFGVQAGTGSYADLVERWRAEGLYPAEVDGASSGFRVFRRGGEVFG